MSIYIKAILYKLESGILSDFKLNAFRLLMKMNMFCSLENLLKWQDSKHKITEANCFVEAENGKFVKFNVTEQFLLCLLRNNPINKKNLLKDMIQDYPFDENCFLKLDYEEKGIERCLLTKIVEEVSFPPKLSKGVDEYDFLGSKELEEACYETEKGDDVDCIKEILKFQGPGSDWFFSGTDSEFEFEDLCIWFKQEYPLCKYLKLTFDEETLEKYF